MAIDEAILEAVGSGAAPPTLRLYAWEPACLSIGYAQPLADASQLALRRLGWHLVRRPTGGRAILHVDELTYAVAAPPHEPRLAGGVLESYRRLAQALLAALRLLGLPARSLAEPPASPYPPHENPVCFEAPSNYEIVAHGKKLIGSAQARRKEGVLQHGSLPLFGDLARITLALSFPDEAGRRAAAERLLARAATVEAILGRRVSWESAAQAFEQAFRETLGLEWISQGLTETELRRADELVLQKYGHPAWTGRV